MPALPRRPQRDGRRSTPTGVATSTAQAAQLVEAIRAVERCGSGVGAADDRAADRARSRRCASVRSGARRLRRRAEVPAASSLEFLLRHARARRLGACARDGRQDARRDGRRRHLRPARRRLPPLLGRRSLARAALREDALRQRAACQRLPARVARHRRRPRYRDVVEETLDYLLREMRLPEGGFASAQDADTKGEEGLTYVWTPDEIGDAARSGGSRARRCALRRDRRRQLRRREHPVRGAAIDDLEDARRGARQAARRARPAAAAAAGRQGARRAGTGWRSPRSPRRPPARAAGLSGGGRGDRASSCWADERPGRVASSDSYRDGHGEDQRLPGGLRERRERAARALHDDR